MSVSTPGVSAPAGPKVRHRDTCRLCAATSLTKVLSLAPTPPANAFVTASARERRQTSYPLDLWLCQSCGHLQLLDIVDPVALFEDYVYTSGTSPVFVRHFEQYAHDVARQVGLTAGNLVVDIGSNDGTLLRFFKAAGCRVLGIDPARDIARRATEQGVETLPVFFTADVASDIRSRYGRAKVVTANNVFAHVDDLGALTEAVRDLLDPDGLFVFEVSYLVDVLQKTLFDTIYHEHLDYHSLISLLPFFARHGLQVVDAVRVDSHGGSLRVVVQHEAGPFSVSPAIARLIADEQGLGVDRPQTYAAFGRQIASLRRDLQTVLSKVKAEGGRIAGFGAPAKATTLMHELGIGADLIDFIVDDSPLKQGLYTPGLHVPVLPSATIYDQRPDYLLVLAWNFADSILARHDRFREGGGHFIVPLPTVRVL